MELNGFYNQNCVFAITEVNEFSTKTPILFTGDILRLGTISDQIENYEEAIQNLYKLKSFPNETILLPNSCYDLLQNLRWIKKISRNNNILDMKMRMLRVDKVQKNEKFLK